jgi:hypothetical protein
LNRVSVPFSRTASRSAHAPQRALVDDDGLITALHIFYDTAASTTPRLLRHRGFYGTAADRQAFERETGGSWPPAG